MLLTARARSPGSKKVHTYTTVHKMMTPWVSKMNYWKWCRQCQNRRIHPCRYWSTACNRAMWSGLETMVPGETASCHQRLWWMIDYFTAGGNWTRGSLESLFQLSGNIYGGSEGSHFLLPLQTMLMPVSVGPYGPCAGETGCHCLPQQIPGLLEPLSRVLGPQKNE